MFSEKLSFKLEGTLRFNVHFENNYKPHLHMETKLQNKKQYILCNNIFFVYFNTINSW